MRTTACLAALFGAVLSVGNASAQPYPSRPITMIVPFPELGAADNIARTIAGQMAKSLKQPIKVENVAGEQGTLGIARAVAAKPDGYTVVLTTWASHVVGSIVRSVKYEPVGDLEPVALIAREPFVVVGKKDFAAKNLQELVIWLKANPDKSTIGILGPGTPPHLAALAFQQDTGVKLQAAPFKSSTQVVEALTAGTLDLAILQGVSIAIALEAEKIKAYGVTARRRLLGQEAIPSAEEEGLPDLLIANWQALWAPKGTPADVIARLTAAVIEATSNLTIRKLITDAAQEIPPRGEQSPQALGRLLKTEIEKWTPIVKAAGTKP